MKFFCFGILLIASSGLYAQNTKFENIGINVIADSVYSRNLDDHRVINIYLPDDYSNEEKYPVIYVLDADWMFKPTAFEAEILMDFDVIPKSIVVGIFHKNRNDDLGIDWNSAAFTESGEKFFLFLTEELIPKIDTTYSTSGFNSLVGHSNSASYTQKVLTQKKQVINGGIALSQNLFGNQQKELNELFEMNDLQPMYYFVASGSRDATPRIEVGMVLDSLFKLQTNNSLKTHHKLYDADHMGIAARGLNDGLSFVYSDYKHYNDWNDKLIDSLTVNNIDPITFIDAHSKKIKDIYGINFKANENDLSLMQALAKNEEELEAVQKFEITNFGKSKHFYAAYAQYYEAIKSYEKALEFWTIHLDKYYQDNRSFFYYRRPLQLLYIKMNEPKRAIEFAEKWNMTDNRYKQFFNYWIARIASETNTNKSKGLKAIQKYISDYSEGLPINLEKAKELEKKLSN